MSHRNHLLKHFAGIEMPFAIFDSSGNLIVDSGAIANTDDRLVWHGSTQLPAAVSRRYIEGPARLGLLYDPAWGRYVVFHKDCLAWNRWRWLATFHVKHAALRGKQVLLHWANERGLAYTKEGHVMQWSDIGKRASKA